MKRRFSSILATLIVLAWSGWCTGQGSKPDPLVTDRPDFTESTETVAPGRFQIEAGYTFSRPGTRMTNNMP
ncbi:MAG: hypothetical protein ACE5K9_11330 [Candidatus Methylomirabilales bacterium]